MDGLIYLELKPRIFGFLHDLPNSVCVNIFTSTRSFIILYHDLIKIFVNRVKKILQIGNQERELRIVKVQIERMETQKKTPLEGDST